jgi:hypothetical protein
MAALFIPEMEYRKQEIGVAHIGSLQWILAPKPQGPGLWEWLQAGTGIYWIKGKPGSRKSTAMRYMIDSNHVPTILSGNSSSSWIIISLFFHDRGREVQKSFNAILQSMLHQLLEKVPALIPMTMEIAERKDEDSVWLDGKFHIATFRWSSTNVRQALEMICKQEQVLFNACVFLDALDEHDGDHVSMGETLKEMATVRNAKVNIKICLSSRPLNEFKDMFHKYPRFQIDEWTKADISTYVHDRLNKNRSYRQLIESPTANSEAGPLIQTIATRAEGVFLWVRLVVEDLREDLTDGLFIPELRQRLSRLPGDLADFFSHLLSKIKDRYRVESYIMFESMIRSPRPLTLHELLMIKEVAKGSDTTRSRAIGKDLNLVNFSRAEYNMKHMKRQLRSHGGLFLEIRSQPGRPPQHQDMTHYFTDPLSQIP